MKERKKDRRVRQVFSFFFLPRCVMPRGWYRAPDGWWQRSLRGPRPKSEVWQRAQQSRQSGSPQSVQEPTPPPSRQVSKPPQKVAADAIGEIQRLQAAIAALGDSTGVFSTLQEALRVAQPRASVLPIQERVDSCKLFLERAKKRVQRAQEVIDRACEQRALCEAEVVEGEAWLANLVAGQRTSKLSQLFFRRSQSFRQRDAMRCVLPLQSRFQEKLKENLDSVLSSPFRRYSAHTHLRRPGSCSLVEPTQLRVAQCNRVRGSSVRGKDWWFGWARRIVALHNETQFPRRRRAITVSTRRRTVRAILMSRLACGRDGLRGVRGRGKSPRSSQTAGSPCHQCARGGFGRSRSRIDSNRQFWNRRRTLGAAVKW